MTMPRLTPERLAEIRRDYVLMPMPDRYQAMRDLLRELDAVTRERERYRPVVEAALAYCDQLGAFNHVMHPEVHRRRLELADAVGRYFSDRLQGR
jgi:hypothetical protein